MNLQSPRALMQNRVLILYASYRSSFVCSDIHFFVCKNTKYTRQIPVENQINEKTYVQLYESCNKRNILELVVYNVLIVSK